MEPKPARNRGPALRRWLPWLLLGVALLALSFLGDPSLDAWFGQHHPKLLRRCARYFSQLLDWPVLVIAAAVVGGLGILFRRRCGRILFLMVLAASLAGLTANVSRCLTGRTRPSSDLPQGWYGPPITKNLRIAKHGINSFPSAHTATAMAYFVTLLILVPKVGIWFLPAPLLLGASRLYLGVHHFSDVCAGLLLGIAVAIFTCRVLAPHWIEFRKWLCALLTRKSLLSKKAMNILLPG